MAKKCNLADLNKLYDDASHCDEELFAEMRSNLLLVSGNHYSRKTQTFFNRIRNSQRVAETQKLRLTKNHIHKITRYYINSIDQKVPGVMIAPQNEMEMQDRKSAELNQAVKVDAENRYNLRDTFRELKHNFVEIGEMCVFMYWDPEGGELRGYEPKLGPNGEQLVGEDGQLIPDKEAGIFTGGFQFKVIPGFNLLRPASAKNMKKCDHIIREMVEIEELKATYSGDQAKLKAIGEGDPEEFIVFDTNRSGYETDKTHVLVRYHFFRPSKVHPMGYFYVSTERGILEEGELPFGVYPIIWEGFDVYATNPRGYSIVKVARPYQAEINRAASQAATHQITVGDDKIIYQAGTKLQPGALLPGVRGLTFQGVPPQILPGRDGGQFLPYIESNINEMYSACMISEVMADSTDNGQLDPYALLFRSASQQQKFAQYTSKVENFLREFWATFLKLAKHYYPDDMVIQAIGKSEAINLAEFRATEPLNYRIKIEEVSETIDTKLGKQIALNHVLQYVGNQLDPKQVGLIVKDMPFLGGNHRLKRLAVDYDNADNDILMMERGQAPFVSEYADNSVYIEAYTARMKQADFQMLSPNIQQIYAQMLQVHTEELKRKELAQQSIKDGMIPTGGALITCSMQAPDPSNPGSTRQVRLPYEALMYLIQRLEGQGKDLAVLEQVNQGVVAQMAQQMGQQNQPGPMNALPGGGGAQIPTQFQQPMSTMAP